MSIKAKRSHLASRIVPPSGHQPTAKLTPRLVEAMADEIAAYHRLFHAVFQRREQHQWSLLSRCGQLSHLERQTIEPMILALKGADPNAIRALQHFIGAGAWDAAAVVQRHQELVADSLAAPDGVVIVDGSGFPKQGPHSAGVARQYCGALGKVANSQEGVFVVYASQQGHTFLDGRLYLPASWFEAAECERRQECGIPAELTFATEPELALLMLRGLVERGVVPFQWVCADEHFGQNPAFLDGVAALGKFYLAEVPAATRVWRRSPAIELPGPGLLSTAAHQAARRAHRSPTARGESAGQRFAASGLAALLHQGREQGADVGGLRLPAGRGGARRVAGTAAVADVAAQAGAASGIEILPQQCADFGERT